MALFKAVAGQCAMFWVVPVWGSLLVLATYAIGRRIGRPAVGLAAAWLVATSATMLFMVMAPMSDVPQPPHGRLRSRARWAGRRAPQLGRASQPRSRF
jgi:hypothetical protein